MSKTILTVDDSASMRMLLKASLTAQGFTIEAANDGRHGLERMHEVKPDLLITDILGLTKVFPFTKSLRR